MGVNADSGSPELRLKESFFNPFMSFLCQDCGRRATALGFSRIAFCFAGVASCRTRASIFAKLTGSAFSFFNVVTLFFPQLFVTPFPYRVGLSGTRTEPIPDLFDAYPDRRKRWRAERWDQFIPARSPREALGTSGRNPVPPSRSDAVRTCHGCDNVDVPSRT